MTNRGLDYGLGRTNIDAETGIRYGVISQHTVGQAWYDSAEPDYGKATCGKCGNEVQEYSADAVTEEWDDDGSDYMCSHCKRTFDSDQAFGDEPLGWNYEGDGYVLTDCLDSDIFVLKSPYFTFAQFCSPCVPGAGNLETFCEDGPKTYALGHDWFEDGVAPYPLYLVETGDLVPPPAK